MKFKKIVASEKIFVEGSYATNKVWLFNVAWLTSVPNSCNRQLRNRVIKSRADAVTRKMKGETVETKPILDLVSKVKLNEFRLVDMSQGVKPLYGFFKGDASRSETVGFQIGGAPTLDAEFFGALTWCAETHVYVKFDTDPVLLVKSGEIVGMICPLNPKCFKNNKE